MANIKQKKAINANTVVIPSYLRDFAREVVKSSKTKTEAAIIFKIGKDVLVNAITRGICRPVTLEKIKQHYESNKSSLDVDK